MITGLCPTFRDSALPDLEIRPTSQWDSFPWIIPPADNSTVTVNFPSRLPRVGTALRKQCLWRDTVPVGITTETVQIAQIPSVDSVDECRRLCQTRFESLKISCNYISYHAARSLCRHFNLPRIRLEANAEPERSYAGFHTDRYAAPSEDGYTQSIQAAYHPLSANQTISCEWRRVSGVAQDWTYGPNFIPTRADLRFRASAATYLPVKRIGGIVDEKDCFQACDEFHDTNGLQQIDCQLWSLMKETKE